MEELWKEVVVEDLRKVLSRGLRLGTEHCIKGLIGELEEMTPT